MNQAKRAMTLDVREVPARSFAVESSAGDWYLVTLRLGAIAHAEQPPLWTCQKNGKPCEWLRFNPTKACAHVLAALVAAEKEGSQ